jgi:hypothetical protein
MQADREVLPPPACTPHTPTSLIPEIDRVHFSFCTWTWT